MTRRHPQDPVAEEVLAERYCRLSEAGYSSREALALALQIELDVERYAQFRAEATEPEPSEPESSGTCEEDASRRRRARPVNALGGGTLGKA